MSRILRHISAKDLKRTHQKKLSEQKERAAQKLKEWQEAEEERKQIEEAAKPYKSSWREETQLQESDWSAISGSRPTNSTAQTFQYGGEGGPTATFSGLGGVEAYPSTVDVDGETLNTPDYSQLGLQGYAAKLNPRYAEAKKKYDEEWKEWERKKEQQQKDIEATLKSFGTSYRNIQRDGGITKVGNSYVAIIPTNTRDFGSNLLNNVRVVRLVPCDPSQPMELTKNVRDISGTKKWNVSNAQYSHDVYLQIGEQPKEPIEQQYLMPRRTDFKDVNPQLDASQEFAQKVGADEFMNARVKDVPEQPTFDVNINDPNNPEYNKQFAPITADDEYTIDNLDQTWGNITRLNPDLAWTQKLAIDYAKGNLTPRKVSPGRTYNAGVLKAIEHNLDKGVAKGDVSTYRHMNPLDMVQTATTRLSIGRFNYKVGAKGIEATDFFNFDGNLNLGVFGVISGLDDVAKKIAEFGQRRAAQKGYKMVSTVTNQKTGKKVETKISPYIDPETGYIQDSSSPDGYGIPIKFTIPWSQVSPQLRNKLDPYQRFVPIVRRKEED